MINEQPIPKPIGDMLIKSGKGIDLPDGRYYHYADVIGFMRAYADQETASLRNEVISKLDSIYSNLAYHNSRIAGKLPLNMHVASIGTVVLVQIDNLRFELNQQDGRSVDFDSPEIKKELADVQFEIDTMYNLSKPTSDASLLAEVERLKGLLKKAHFCGWMDYPSETSYPITAEQSWQQFKTNNNL